MAWYQPASTRSSIIVASENRTRMAAHVASDTRVTAENEASECKHRIAQPKASHHGPEQFQRLARRVGRMDAGQRGRYVCGVRWFEWCNARRVWHPRRRRQQVHFIDLAHGRTPDSRGSAAVLAIIDPHTYRPTSAMSSTISAGTRS